MKTMTLWQVIEALPQQLPFTKAKIEALFSTSLIEKRRSTHTTFLEGGSVSLAQGCLISKIDLRLGNEANDPGFMVLNIGGTCTTIEHVRRHYGDLQIAGTPRGNSLDDVTSHSTMQPWGELSFSFKERNPDCLSSIALDPKKPN